MPVPHTIRFDSQFYQQAKNLADQQGRSFNELVNIALKNHVLSETRDQIDSMHLPLIEQKLDETLKRMENRIASGVYRSAYDTAQLLFMLLPIAADAFGEDQEETFERTRGMAVKHVNRKRDEL